MKKKQFYKVTGMTCSACSSHVEKAVAKLEGVDQVSVSLLTNQMVVEYDADKIQDLAIINAVEQAGYEAFLPIPDSKVVEEKKQEPIKQELADMKKRILLSTIFLLPLMYLSMGHMLGWPLPSIFLGEQNAFLFSFTQLLLTFPILAVNQKYYHSGLKAIKNKAPNMDSLIAIGSMAAFVYGLIVIYQIGYSLGHGKLEQVHHYSMSLYFESAGMILTLVTLGKYLETRSKNKTSDAIYKLINLSPKTATILVEGKEKIVPTEEIRKGDRLLIKPGDTIPVDGKVIEGSSYVDQSAITGESIPIKKEVGDRVISATLNQAGSFQFEAQKVGEDTTLSQIIRLVEEASSSKAPISKLADKVSSIFVPTVIIIAVLATIVWLFLGYSFEFALSIGIAVLVISCPCALGLATPVSIMVATGKAAESGILVKTAESLEIAHSIDALILDKTGTITTGKMQVVGVVSTEDKDLFYTVAMALEKNSNHPIAKAILTFLKEQKQIKEEQAKDFEIIEGKGIQAFLEGEKYIAGNRDFMQEQGVLLTLQPKEEIATNIYVAKQNHLLGIFSIRDKIKQNSRQAISQIQKMGIEVYMMTGDEQKTAQTIAKEAGIENIMANVLPQDKEKKVRQLQEQGKKVAMVGDGINDSPAITRANLGIAIGAGTDIAIESADMVLMKSDLKDVITALQLSKKTIQNIKMNLFWAFFYNTISIPIAAGIFYPIWGVRLNPMIAAAAMSLSSVCVVLNALRLKRFVPNQKDKKGSLKRKEENKMIIEIQIEGMSCNHCKQAVEKALQNVPEVQNVTVSVEEKKAVIQGTEKLEKTLLKQAIKQAGYEVKK